MLHRVGAWGGGRGELQTGTSPLFLVADSCLLFWDLAASSVASPAVTFLSSLYGAALPRFPPSQEAPECGSGTAGLGTAEPGLGNNRRNSGSRTTF